MQTPLLKKHQDKCLAFTHPVPGEALSDLPAIVYLHFEAKIPDPFPSGVLLALRSLQREVSILKLINLHFKKMLGTLQQTYLKHFLIVTFLFTSENYYKV